MVTNEVVRGAAVAQALEDAWPASAAFIADLAGLNSGLYAVRNVQRENGLGKLTAIFNAAAICKREGVLIDRLALARRVDTPVPDIPEIEVAYLYYRYLIRLGRSSYTTEAGGTESRMPEGLALLWQAIGRTYTHESIDLAAWSEAVVAAWHTACRRDPLGVLPANRLNHAFAICHDMASVFGRWQPAMGACAALGLLNDVTFYEGDEVGRRPLPYAEGLARTGKPVGEKIILRRAHDIRHAWTSSVDGLVAHGATRREGSFYKEFSDWAQSHFIYNDRDVSTGLSCSRRTASRLLISLCKQNILTEYTGRDRDRLYTSPSIRRLMLL